MRLALDETPQGQAVDDARLVAEIGTPWKGLEDAPMLRRQCRA